MNEESAKVAVADSWNTYWQSPHANAAYTSNGAGHPSVLAFWNDYFREVHTREDSPRIIDIASGNGAVVDCAKTVFAENLPDFTCLDVSSAAIDLLKSRLPGVNGVIADAKTIPLDSGMFDLATSQFGLEYAGLDALDEVIRILSDKGELVLLLHHRGGSIYAHCHEGLEAIREVRASQFISHSIATFDAGFASLKGDDHSDYSAAGNKLAPAITAMGAIIDKYGVNVVDGLVVALYRDVRTILSRMSHYHPDDVSDWLHKMQEEVEAYEGRMASMCEAAIDSEAFAALRQSISDKSLEIVKSEALEVPGEQSPIAWVLVARK
ncbi:MAG: class I SAM-dependent methyltransferase [Gammaproteobacteria bacterium]|nr:class I SAM-dependent methyltransferase [Gammaproteobacteria bacterium]